MTFDNSEFSYQGVSLTGEVCIVCGCHFAVPTTLISHARKEGKFAIMIHCPSGHRFGWGDSEADRLRRERDLLKQQIAAKDDAIREERIRADDAIKRETRLRKRVNAGLCPCCNRSFANLQRHMQTKHKETNVVKLGLKTA